MGEILRVLIVEDSENDARLVLRELRRGGFEPQHERVETPATLREALARQTWDVVISDYRMPAFSGPEALSLLREMGLDPPFILVSGTIGEEQAVDAIKLGAYDYCLKDRLVRLAPTVRRAMAEAEERRTKRAAEELLARLRRAVDASGEVVFMTDPQGVFTFVNPEFTRLYGHSPEDVVGKATCGLLQGDPEPTAPCACIQAARSDGHVSKSERERRTRDGRTVWVESSVNAILDAAARVTGFVAIERDITERRRAEEERRRLEAQLLQAQKMEVIARLAGGVAHDFNNILTAMQGYCDLAMSGVDPSSPLHADLDQIHLLVTRAAALTRQLLLFSRRRSLSLVPTDLNGLVENLLKMLRRLIGEDIAIETELASGLRAVLGDPGSIEQVVMNLVVNARDAMPGGGKVVIRTENVVLDEGGAAKTHGGSPGRFVRLSVIDTGCGMPPSVLSRLFEPFFTTKEPGKGTGLGLSVVRGIAERHGGFLAVESVPGHGSSFSFHVPALPQEAVVCGPAPRSAETQMRGAGRILLVEDEPGIRGVVGTALRSAGYDVLEAATAAVARRIFEREATRIDLLLGDVVLPDGNGLDLIESLLACRPELRVIVTSGYVDERSQLARIEERKLRFLQKPYGVPLLLDAVREALGAPGSAPDIAR